MENKTLSVIIPNYNKKEYIRDTIESILKQTYRPNEIIIVDDCSYDCSKVIIKEYETRYPFLIKAIYLEHNRGVQYARNYGAKLATSDYITFVDSDDLYHDEHKLEKEIKLVNKRRIVFSRYCILDNNTGRVSFPDYKKIEERTFTNNVLYCYLNYKKMLYWPFCFIVSKNNFLKVNGYNFPYNYYEDLDLLIKFKLAKLRFARTNIYGYKRRENNRDVYHLSDNSHILEDVNKEFHNRYSIYIGRLARIRYKFFHYIELCIAFFLR